MLVRMIAIAIASAALSAPLSAEPANLTASSASGGTAPRTIAVLASADHVAVPADSGEADPATPPAPAKRPRAARVTTCRCADTPAPSADE